MGQDLKAVEEAVGSLEASDRITSQQAEAFLRDFNNRCESLQDVRKFHEAPQLSNFLKYYIHNRYQDGAEATSRRPTSTASKHSTLRMEEDDNSHLLIQILGEYKLMMLKA